jgi:hypothetical protein
LWDESSDEDWAAHCGGDNPFAHDTLFNTFFEPHPDLAGLTMYALVSTGGGPNIVRKTARFLVAAYLNAACGSVNFGMTTTELVQLWEDAVDGTITFHEAFNTLTALYVDEFGEELMCPVPLEGVDLEPIRPKKDKGPRFER